MSILKGDANNENTNDKSQDNQQSHLETMNNEGKQAHQHNDSNDEHIRTRKRAT